MPVRLKPGLWLGLWNTLIPFFFSPSFAGLAMCLGLLSCYMMQRSLCYTVELMDDSVIVRCPRPSQHASTTMLTVGRRCLCWYSSWPNICIVKEIFWFPSKQTILVHSFPNCTCSVWHVVYLFWFLFCNYFKDCRVWPWGEFAGVSTPGKINNCLEFSIFLTVEWSCLKIALIPFPDWWAATIPSLLLLMYFLFGTVLKHT